jgi:hypothetical protein
MFFYSMFGQSLQASQLRKNHLSKCHEKTLNKIGVRRRKENIWVPTDKPTNGSGRKIANVVSGVFKNDQMLSGKPFILSCQEMSAVNHTTLASVFNEAVLTLSPDGVKYDMQFIVTDTVHVKELAGLPVSNTKLIHVYAVHASCRVCETIHVLYPDIDKSVANGKEILVKTPARTDSLKIELQTHHSSQFQLLHAG